jgi:hypothetical protein
VSFFVSTGTSAVYRNDVWKFDTSSLIWTWCDSFGYLLDCAWHSPCVCRVGGSTAVNAAAGCNYGVKTVPVQSQHARTLLLILVLACVSPGCNQPTRSSFWVFCRVLLGQDVADWRFGLDCGWVRYVVYTISSPDMHSHFIDVQLAISTTSGPLTRALAFGHGDEQQMMEHHLHFLFVAYRMAGSTLASAAAGFSFGSLGVPVCFLRSTLQTLMCRRPFQTNPLVDMTFRVPSTQRARFGCWEGERTSVVTVASQYAALLLTSNQILQTLAAISGALTLQLCYGHGASEAVAFRRSDPVSVVWLQDGRYNCFGP